MQKNVASQKITLFAFIPSTSLPKTGDAANLTAYVAKDDGTVTVLADTSATETDATNAKGLYTFDVAQGETNADKLVFSCKSSTSDVAIVPVTVYTRAANANLLSIDSNGRIDVIKVAGTAQTAGDIIADTNDIQTRLPASLVSGRMDVSVGAMAANVLTATAINADAITDAKVASDVTIASVTGAVGSVAGAVGSVTGNVGGNVTGSVGSVATGGIVAASFAAGAIDAAAIAADAIGASELAASAVAEIQSGLSTLDAAGIRTAVGLASANLDTQLSTIDDFLDTEITAIKAKTDNLPAAPAAVGDIPTANQNADAYLDRSNAIETGVTPRQAIRLLAAALAGKVSGGGTTTITFRNAVQDSKNRIVATVDVDGNRSAITYDAS